MSERSSEHSKIASCAIIALIPLILLVTLVTIFIINNRPPNIKVYTPKMPKDNGWDYFVRAGELVRKAHHPGPLSSTRPLSSWTIPEYKSFVNDNKPALRVLRQGLTKNYLHPPLRTINAQCDIFSVYARLRELARTSLGEALYYETIGDWKKAMDARLDCIEFGVTLPRGGGLIAGLVGYATESIGEADSNGHSIYDVIMRLGPDDLTRAAKRIELIRRKRESYSETIREEGRINTSLGNKTLQHRVELDDIKEWFIDDSTGKLLSTKKTWVNIRYGFSNKKAMLLENQSYYKTVAKEQSRYYTGKTRVTVPKNRLVDFGYGFVLEICARGDVVYAYQQANLALIQTTIALRQYYAAHGQYPSKLTDLKPAHMKSVPVDPFGKGKLIRYRVKNAGKGFCLYSLGPNLRDDGGVPGKWNGKATRGDIAVIE